MFIGILLNPILDIVFSFYISEIIFDPERNLIAIIKPQNAKIAASIKDAPGKYMIAFSLVKYENRFVIRRGPIIAVRLTRLVIAP